MQKIDSLLCDGSLRDEEFIFYCKCENLKDKCKYNYVEESVKDWTEKRFREKQGIIFVGALGIAVRAISEFVDNKITDSMVVVLDDKGQFAIPVLSGHVGGANEMAKNLSKLLGSVPVITTATDNHNKFAVDVWAKKNHLFIANKDGIAKVSSKILNNEQIVMAFDSFENVDMESLDVFNNKNANQIKIISLAEANSNIKETEKTDVYVGCDIVDASLILRPKNYVVGIGCKKDKAYDEINEHIHNVLAEANIDLNYIEYITSVDAKKDEKGILEFAYKNGLDFITYSVETLEAVQGEFENSEFVRNTIGVGNVCERAAMCNAGDEAELVVHKNACNGVTVAVAMKKWKVKF